MLDNQSGVDLLIAHKEAQAPGLDVNKIYITYPTT